MKRKWLAIGIILLCVGVTIATAMAQNTEKSQSTSRGNWLYVGGSGPGNYTAIQDAVNDANNGDIIYVYSTSSPYYEHVMINKSIELIGENKNTTVIDGNHIGIVLTVSADDVHIEGFTIQRSGLQWWNTSGIALIDCKNCIISLCVIKQNSNGISFQNSSEDIIFNCNIISNSDGIEFKSHDYDDSANYGNNILFNTVQFNSGVGIAFLHNEGYHFGNTISGNNISYNGDGVSMVTSGNNDITYNQFYSNEGYAVTLTTCDCGGEYNNVSQNNFMLNNAGGTQGYNFGGGLNYWDRNYWSDYNGTDSNHDGIGDTPYNIDGDPLKDHYPWMNPTGNNNQGPETPIITGPTNGKTGKPYTYHLFSSDPDGDEIFYLIKWDDNANICIIGPGSSEEWLSEHHTWLKPGTYVIGSKAMDVWGSQSADWSHLTVNISRITPDPPVIEGPTRGKINVTYTYNFSVPGSEEDSVYYYIDWGDNTNSGWLGPYPPDRIIHSTHLWSEKGSFQVKAKAKDIYDNEGEWGTLSVTMPYSYERPAHQFWLKILERFPYAFPILRHMMGY